MGKRKNVTYWNIPVPTALNDIVEKAIELKFHASKSDFIRDTIRMRLRRMGLLVDADKNEE